MIVTSKITMDLARPGATQKITVVQDDKYSRNLEITLVANSAAWQIPEGATAIIRYSRPDGTGGNYEVMPDGSNAYTISDNVLTVAMAPAVCAVPGPVHLAVGLINDAQEINTFAIDLHVQRNPGLEVTSTGDYKILGSVADSGWTPNMYLGTDEDGDVVVKEAPGGAELQDIRVGYDGTEYKSAGEAVRGQIVEVHDTVDSIAVKSPNLFNKDSELLKTGYIVNANGYTALNNYAVTHPIKVLAGKAYKYPYFSYLGSQNWYQYADASGNLIDSPIKSTIDGEFSTFAATQTGYVVVNAGRITESVASFMFCEADKYPDDYSPFGIAFALSVDGSQITGEIPSERIPELQQASAKIADIESDLSEIAEKSPNLFNKDSELLKTGYIVNASGFYPLNNYSATHPIAVETGKSYKYPYCNALGSNTYISYVDSVGNLVGSPVKATLDGDFLTFTATQDGYVAVNIGYTNLLDTFMFCEADKYPDEYLSFGLFSRLKVDASMIEGEIPLPDGAGSPIYGKTIIWDGDSICAGKAFDDTTAKDAWAGRIATANAMTHKNYAVSGGTITENVLTDSGATRHSVSATVETMYSEYPDADYIIFEGGTNDADLLGSQLSGAVPDRLGSFSISDFSGNYDRDTFCGALESIFYRATRYWKGKKIGYVVAQKMGRNANGYTSEVDNRRAYFEKAIQICKKWGIPYVNLWDDCYLNPQLSFMYDNTKTATENCAAGSLYADGQHLSSAGYDFTASIIEAWLKTL